MTLSSEFGTPDPNLLRPHQEQALHDYQATPVEYTRIATLTVLDATFFEGDTKDNEYVCGIRISFEDNDTNELFRCILTTADIGQILSAFTDEKNIVPSSREMVNLAKWYSDRDETDFVTLKVTSNGESGGVIPASELILQSQDDAKVLEEEANGELVYDEPTVVDLPVVVGIRRFREDAFMPTKATQYAAGFDIRAHIIVEVDSTKIVPAPDHAAAFLERLNRQVDVPAMMAANPESIEEPFASTITIPPQGGLAVINTGLNLRIPVGYELQIRPRSGLARKNQITVMNSPGTIDADYDGDGADFELKIMLVNHGDKPFVVKHGDRVAQMVVQKLPDVELQEVYGDNPMRHGSERAGGLGSTGSF